MRTEIKPEHKELLDKIRSLHVESGGELMYKPEDYGLNPHKTCRGGIVVNFDYGTPQEMITSDGYYVILGSCGGGDSEKFWELFTQAFNVKILKPKRDDAEVRRRSELEYQLSYSGPVVQISPK